MSCTRDTGKVAFLAGGIGIPRLASKAAAIGVAAGLVGGVALLAVARKYARRAPGLGGLAGHRSGPMPGTPTAPRDVPALSSRAGLLPADVSKLTGDCPGCDSSPESKRGAWYVIGGKPYCQDCAPGAAREAKVNLVLPPSPSSPEPPAWRSGERPSVKMVFAREMSPRSPSIKATTITPGADTDDDRKGKALRGRILDAERSVEIEMDRQRVKLTWDGASKRRTVDADAYLVLTAEGEETGLAITPRIAVEDGRLRIDDTRWGVTHLDSGVVLTEEHWFDNPIEAEGLASILAQINWRRPVEDISKPEMADTGRTVRAYHEALRVVK